MIQILSALTGCKKSARKVNLINTGKREDVYTDMCHTLNNISGKNFTRKFLKDPLMTVFYDSTEQPKLAFGDGTPEHQAFYKTIQEDLTGCWNALQTVRPLWNPNWTRYGWTLPDEHVVDIPVMKKKDFKIEVAEFFKRTFTFRTIVNEEKDFSRELNANIVHSVDAYIVREMFRKAHVQGWELATIHDSFWCLPSNVNQMRINFNQILSDIAKSNLFTDILRELTGNHTASYKKYSDDLWKDILDADYAIL